MIELTGPPIPVVDTAPVDSATTISHYFGLRTVRATLLLDPIADVGKVEPDVVPDLHDRNPSL